MLAIEKRFIDHNDNASHSEKTSAQAWIVCFSAALFFFYEFIQMNMFNAIDPDLMRVFHINATELGKLSACYFYANLVFLFPAGTILDRFSTRKIILTTLAICVFGTVAFAMSTNILVASICRFLTGIGSAFCFLSSVRLASRWFPNRRMALVMGLIVTMAMIGGMVAQTPLTLLTQSLGWRHALLVIAGLGAAIIFIVWYFVQDYPATYHERRTTEQQQLQELGFWKSLKLSGLNIQNWLGGIYTSLFNLPVCLLGSLWGSLYLMQAHHLSRTDASYVTTMVFVGTIIGSPLAGWLSDRIGLRRLPMIIGALLALPLVLILIYIPTLSMLSLMVVFFLLGLMTSTQVISYPTIAESNPKILTATSVSVISTCAIGGYAIFQPLFGELMDSHWNGLIVDKVAVYALSDYQRGLFIMPIGFVIGLIAALLLKETYCRSKHSENHSADSAR